MDRPTLSPAGRVFPTERMAEWFRPQRILIVALMALAVAGFFLSWSARVDRALLLAETKLVDSHRTLQATLSSATAQLDLIKLQTELYLNDPAPRPPRPLTDWLQPSPVLGVFAGIPPLTDASLGYLSLGAPLPEPGSERAREIEMASRLTPLFASVKKNVSSVTWVYYYSQNRLLAVFPYEHDSIYWSDELLTSEVFVCAGPALNPYRGMYWSNVYADVAGRGLMCSAAIPIYDGNGRFRAIVGFDFTVDILMTYLAGQDLTVGTPFLVNRAGQLLAHPTLVRSSDKEVHWIGDALPPELRQNTARVLGLPAGKFSPLGGAYVAAFDLDVAPWRLLFVADKRSLGLSILGDMHFELAVLVLLLLALLFFLKIDRLSAALRKLMVAVESSDVAVIMTDSRGEIEFVNKGFCQSTGYEEAEAIGRTPRLLKSGQTSAETYRELWQTVKDGHSWHGDLLDRRKDGSLFWATTDISPIMNNQGTPTNFVAVQLDVTEKRRLGEELARLAVTDPLSGLANRRRFMAVLKDETERARRTGVPFALLMFDIDHFKRVNDRYGHSAGDKAIVALSSAMAAATRGIDTVGRLGGEEFGVILPATGPDEAVVAAERIRRAVEGMDVATGDGEVFRMTVSAGAAVLEGDIDPEELLRRADTALYASKNAGRNRVTAFRAR